MLTFFFPVIFSIVSAIEGSKYLRPELITIPVLPALSTATVFRFCLTEKPVNNEPVITAESRIIIISW